MKLYLPLISLLVLSSFYRHLADIFPDAGLAWIVLVIYAIVYLLSAQPANSWRGILLSVLDVVLIIGVLIFLQEKWEAILVRTSFIPLTTFLLSMVLWVGYGIFTSKEIKKDLNTKEGTGGILFMIFLTLSAILYFVFQEIISISQVISGNEEIIPYIVVVVSAVGTAGYFKRLNRVNWKSNAKRSKKILPHVAIITLTILVYAVITTQL